MTDHDALQHAWTHEPSQTCPSKFASANQQFQAAYVLVEALLAAAPGRSDVMAS